MKAVLPQWIALRFPYLSLECLSLEYPSLECPSLKCPSLPTDSLPATQKDSPALVHHKQKVYMLNPAALAEGVTLGMSLPQVRALTNAVSLFARHEQQEQYTLNQLINQLYKVTPHIQLLHYPGQGYGEYCIALEVSRSVALFGGWPEVVKYTHQVLAEHPYTTVTAAAHSQQAAWLLTWSHQHNPFILDFQQQQAELAQLPIQYLLPFPKIIHQLDSIGFHTLADLHKQAHHNRSTPSYAPLQKRFGKPFCQFLQAVFEIQATEIKPNYHPQPAFREELEFDYPVSNVEWLLTGCEKLLCKLTDYLRRHQHQAHCITWHLYEHTGRHHSIEIRSHSPSSQGNLFLELSEIHFQQTPLPFAVDHMELICEHSFAKAEENSDLFGQAHFQQERQNLEKLATKLRVRLGDHALHQLSRLDDHLPEKSQHNVPCLESCTSGQNDLAPRPTWLFDPPIALRYQQQAPQWYGPLNLLIGPERLTGPWWEQPGERDYFLAVRGDFTRCWVFYERMEKQWYVQGIFA